jgi:hypothetical protein
LPDESSQEPTFMPMRKDCRHYFKRTAANSTEIVEGCSLNAAPDAPQRCPKNCPYFEKRRLSTTGFVYGSLAPEPAQDDEPATDSSEDEKVLDTVKALFDEIGDQVAAEEAAKRAGVQKLSKRRWWRRWR